ICILLPVVPAGVVSAHARQGNIQVAENGGRAIRDTVDVGIDGAPIGLSIHIDGYSGILCASGGTAYQSAKQKRKTEYRTGTAPRRSGKTRTCETRHNLTPVTSRRRTTGSSGISTDLRRISPQREISAT